MFEYPTAEIAEATRIAMLFANFMSLFDPAAIVPELKMVQKVDESVA